jgi:hypothetical protein
MAKQTLGEYRVGLDFNPSADPRVTDLKQKAAAFIDAVDALLTTIPEMGRLKSLAMTHAEDAAMWAVKAATKRPME